MIEAAVEMDDDALGAYLDGKEPDVATLKRCIRKATVTRAFYPMLCGSAFKNKGVQPLLDAVVDYLPSPSDREAYKGIDVKTGEPTERKPLDSEPLSLLAFKIMNFEHVGSITFCRVYSGTLQSRHGADQYDARQEGARRPHVSDARRPARGDQGSLYRRHRRAVGPEGHAHRRDAVGSRPSPCCSRRWTSPTPSSRCRSSPRPRPIRRRWAWRLHAMALEDPSFRVGIDQESGQTILKGMGELHLDIKVDILKRTHGVEANVGAPQVAYRETLARADRDRLHAQEADRRHRPVRPRQAAARAERGRQGQRVRERDRRRRRCPRSTSRASRRACRASGMPAC